MPRGCHGNAGSHFFKKNILSQLNQIFYLYDLALLGFSYVGKPSLFKTDSNQVKLTCGIGSGSRFSASNDYREGFRWNRTREHYDC